MNFSNDKTVKNFIENLFNQGKSKISVKNYKSDILHFLAWAALKLKSLGSYVESVNEIIPFLGRNFTSEYKKYLIENNIKIKTANRRLSTLRNFSSFLYENQLVDEDFMQGIQNLGIGIIKPVQKKAQDITERFRESLSANEDVSANTLKNYISDVRSFLEWTESESVSQKGELPNAT